MSKIENYEIIKEIVNGQLGKIYKAKNKNTSKLYAIKEIDFSKMNEKDKLNIINEANLFKKINSINVIAYIDSFKCEETNKYYLITEYANDGDINTKINEKKLMNNYYSEYELLLMYEQIANGLNDLHSLGIIHGNIKASNVLITKTYTDKLKLGIINLNKENKNIQNDNLLYSSPEILDKNLYTFKSDIWSLGCLFYQLASFSTPFKGNTFEELYKNVYQRKIKKLPSIYSKDLLNIILMCLRQEEKIRPTAEELLKIIKKLLMKTNNLKKNLTELELHTLNKNNYSKLKRNYSSYDNNQNINLKQKDNSNYNKLYLNQSNKLCSILKHYSSVNNNHNSKISSINLKKKYYLKVKEEEPCKLLPLIDSSQYNKYIITDKTLNKNENKFKSLKKLLSAEINPKNRLKLNKSMDNIKHRGLTKIIKMKEKFSKSLLIDENKIHNIKIIKNVSSKNKSKFFKLNKNSQVPIKFDIKTLKKLYKEHQLNNYKIEETDIPVKDDIIHNIDLKIFEIKNLEKNEKPDERKIVKKIIDIKTFPFHDIKTDKYDTDYENEIPKENKENKENNMNNINIEKNEIKENKENNENIIIQNKIEEIKNNDLNKKDILRNTKKINSTKNPNYNIENSIANQQIDNFLNKNKNSIFDDDLNKSISAIEQYSSLNNVNIFSNELDSNKIINNINNINKEIISNKNENNYIKRINLPNILTETVGIQVNMDSKNDYGDTEKGIQVNMDTTQTNLNYNIYNVIKQNNIKKYDKIDHFSFCEAQIKSIKRKNNPKIKKNISNSPAKIIPGNLSQKITNNLKKSYNKQNKNDSDNIYHIFNYSKNSINLNKDKSIKNNDNNLIYKKKSLKDFYNNNIKNNNIPIKSINNQNNINYKLIEPLEETLKLNTDIKFKIQIDPNEIKSNEKDNLNNEILLIIGNNQIIMKKNNDNIFEADGKIDNERVGIYHKKGDIITCLYAFKGI